MVLQLAFQHSQSVFRSPVLGLCLFGRAFQLIRNTERQDIGLSGRKVMNALFVSGKNLLCLLKTYILGCSRDSEDTEYLLL